MVRISHLECLLLSRSQPRPISLVTSDSSLSDVEPSDEILRLIADLKAKRDELKRDINGRCTRVVVNLEKQSSALVLHVLKYASAPVTPEVRCAP